MTLSRVATVSMARSSVNVGISSKWSSGNEKAEVWWHWSVDDRSGVGIWSSGRVFPKKPNARTEISSSERPGSDESNDIAGGEGKPDAENSPGLDRDPVDKGGDI